MSFVSLTLPLSLFLPFVSIIEQMNLLRLHTSFVLITNLYKITLIIKLHINFSIIIIIITITIPITIIIAIAIASIIIIITIS